MKQLQINPRWEGNIINNSYNFGFFHFSLTMLLQLDVWLTSQKV